MGGGCLTSTLKIQEPSHARLYREKFHSGCVVEGMQTLLTDVLPNRKTNNTTEVAKIANEKVYALHGIPMGFLLYRRQI